MLWVALITSLSISGAAESARGPVVVIGADGLTYDVLDPLVAAGKLPTFERMLKQGARAVLMSENPMRSPALWTTVATGQPRDVHGIYDFVTGSNYWPKNLRQTKRQLVTADMRQARALWQFAGDANKTSVVVGWLNTWPAEKLKGVMVAPYVALGAHKQTSIKGRIYEDGKSQTHPKEAFQQLRPLIVDTDAVDAALIAKMVDEPPHDSHLYKAIPLLRRYMYTARWSAASLLSNVAILEKLLKDQPNTDLVMTYFDGADTLAHRFWLLREPLPKVRARLSAHGIDPALAGELKRRFSGALDGYYQVLDQALARIIKAAGPNATVMVVSDHGWGASKRTRAVHDDVPFDGEHREEGFFLGYGKNVKPGRYKALTLYDIAPTTLHAMGLHVPESLPGKVAEDVLDMKRLGPVRRQMVASERQRKDKAQTEPHFGEAELERLKSLGYVQ